jgi:hypothetical protein
MAPGGVDSAIAQVTTSFQIQLSTNRAEKEEVGKPDKIAAFNSGHHEGKHRYPNGKRVSLSATAAALIWLDASLLCLEDKSVSTVAIKRAQPT